MDRRALLLILALALAGLGCPNSSGAPCPETACPAGTVCDANSERCEDSTLHPIDGPLSARGVQLAHIDDQFYYAAIDPEAQTVIAGEIARDVRDVRTIATLQRPRRRIALSASSPRIAVAWLDATRNYRLASRLTRDPNDAWTVQSINADRNYQGTEDFDLLLDHSGIQLAFRATDGTLKVLRGTSIGDDATLSLVDGGPLANGTDPCPRAVREAQNRGIGREPTLRRRPNGGLVIAYQDADCGDLRIADELESAWEVQLVDTGLESRTGRAIPSERVGRYPSAALDTNGRLHIAYFDETRRRLLYARETTQGWEHQVVDDGLRVDAYSRERNDIVGIRPSLLLFETGESYLSYLNSTTHEPRIATRTGDAAPWTVRRPDLSALGSSPILTADVQLTTSNTLDPVIALEELIPSEQGHLSRLVVLWE